MLVAEVLKSKALPPFHSVILSGVWRAFFRQTESKEPEEARPAYTFSAIFNRKGFNEP
jgi:hypothetical protein